MQGVYLIEGGGLFKIGITSSISSRMQQMRTGSPLPLKIVHFWDYNINADDEFGDGWADAVEGRWHCALKDFQDHGEWFNLPPDVAGVVESMFWWEEYPEDGQKITELSCAGFAESLGLTKRKQVC